MENDLRQYFSDIVTNSYIFNRNFRFSQTKNYSQFNYIGVGRFRILGEPRFRILGGQGGGKFPAGT